MRRNVLVAAWVLGALLVVMLCEPAEARFRRQSVGNASTSHSQQNQVTQRITQLPEDADWPTVTLMVHDDWSRRPEEKAMVAKWQAMPDWQNLDGKFHWVVYRESSEAYQQRLRKDYPVLPAVVAQDPDGRVFFKDQASAVSQQTCAEIKVDEHCRRCDRQQPDRSKTVNVDLVVEPLPGRPAIPEKVGVKNQQGDFWAMLFIGSVVSGAITAAIAFAMRVRKTPTP